MTKKRALHFVDIGGNKILMFLMFDEILKFSIPRNKAKFSPSRVSIKTSHWQ